MNPHPHSHLMFHKGTTTIQWKKDRIFNKWCSFNWLSAYKGMEINPLLSPCTKLKSKWFKNLHIKPDTLKLQEEKVGKSLDYMGTGENFLNRTPMAYALRSRVDNRTPYNCKASVRQRTLSIGQKSSHQIGKRYLRILYLIEG